MKHYKIVLLILILILIDQGCKICMPEDIDVVIIPNILNLKYVQNTGMAFSLGKHHLSAIVVSNILILFVIIKIMISHINNMSVIANCMLSFCIAGGISNLIDRIFKGYVIDYISVTNFSIFNIADIFIVTGGIGILLLMIRGGKVSWKEI